MSKWEFMNEKFLNISKVSSVTTSNLVEQFPNESLGNSMTCFYFQEALEISDDISSDATSETIVINSDSSESVQWYRLNSKKCIKRCAVCIVMSEHSSRSVNRHGVPGCCGYGEQWKQLYVSVLGVD